MSVRSSLNHKRLSPASSGSQGGGSPTPSHRSSIRGTRGETADESFNEGLDLLQEAFNRKYFELVNQCKHWERIATQSKQEAEELEDQNRQLKSAVVDLKVRVDALQEQNTSYFDENKALERQKQRAERRLTLLEDQKDAPKAEAPRQALGEIDVNNNCETMPAPDLHGSAVKKAPRISLGAELEEASMKPPSMIPPRSAKKTTRDSEADAIRDSIRQELQQLRRTSSASVVSVDHQENRRSSISKASRDMLRRRDEQPKSRQSMTSMRSRSSLSRAREASGMDPFTSRRESISPTESLPQDPQRRSSNASMRSQSTKEPSLAAAAPQTQKFQAVYAKISKILQGRELKKFHMLIYAFDDKKIKLEPMLAKASELLASDPAVLQEFTDVVKSEMSSHRKQSRSPKEAQPEAVKA